MIKYFYQYRPIFFFGEWAADRNRVFKQLFYTGLLPDLKGGGKPVTVIADDDDRFSCADGLTKFFDGREEKLHSEQATAIVRLQTVHRYS